VFDLGTTLIAVVLFALLLPLLVLPWIHAEYERHGRLTGWIAVLSAAEVLYLCGLAAYTLFPLPRETAAFCASRSTSDFLVLNPVGSLDGTVAGYLQVALNVLLFVPLGYALRYHFRRGIVVAGLIGLGVSLLIEVAQGTAVFGAFGCPYRVADTGDLVTNTLGTLVGWLLAVATARLLPDPVPAHSADLARPGLVRRGLSVLADLLIGWLVTSLILAVVVVSGGPDSDWLALIVYTGIYAITTLALPMLRHDHATLGQVTFFLRPSTGRRVPLRWLVWWLPVTLLQATGHLGVALLAAAVIGLLARLRTDRRSVLEMLTGTTTITRNASEHEPEQAVREAGRGGPRDGG
jgi:glycopeptide antibiotics resistance protein